MSVHRRPRPFDTCLGPLLAGLAVLPLLVAPGCANRGMEGPDDGGDPFEETGGAPGAGTGGHAGSRGAGGSLARGGTTGAAGRPGTAGRAGSGGSPGTGGLLATGGITGRPGTGGLGTGGVAGRAGLGTGGQAGARGTGGRANTGGITGAAGARGTGGAAGSGGRGGPGGRSGVGGSAAGGHGGAAAQGGATGQTGPCAELCANPVLFTAATYSSGALGTGATCHQTDATLEGIVCGNFVAPRKLAINGEAISCSGASVTELPARLNGGYCIQATAGNQSFAYFTTY